MKVGIGNNTKKPSFPLFPLAGQIPCVYKSLCQLIFTETFSLNSGEEFIKEPKFKAKENKI
jgi:hypothetical protein